MPERLGLRKPLTSLTVTQRFGEDLTCVDLVTRKKCVMRNAGANCPFGYKSLYTSLGMKGHNGVDFMATDKQPVYAATGGKVSRLSSETERGIGVEIISSKRYLIDVGSKSYCVKTRYWHLLSFAVRKGDRVQVGQLIGWADNTGLSSGTHLHFELKPVRRTLTGRYVSAFPRNGYFGAIDPEPYFID